MEFIDVEIYGCRHDDDDGATTDIDQLLGCTARSKNVPNGYECDLDGEECVIMKSEIKWKPIG